MRASKGPPLPVLAACPMSTLKTTLQVVGVTVAVATVATAYVLIHEHRRKGKKDKKLAAAAEASGSGSSDTALSVDKLIVVLGESANAAYQLIEQVSA